MNESKGGISWSWSSVVIVYMLFGIQHALSAISVCVFKKKLWILLLSSAVLFNSDCWVLKGVLWGLWTTIAPVCVFNSSPICFYDSRNKCQTPAVEMGSDCQVVVSMKIPGLRAVKKRTQYPGSSRSCSFMLWPPNSWEMFLTIWVWSSLLSCKSQDLKHAFCSF